MKKIISLCILMFSAVVFAELAFCQEISDAARLNLRRADSLYRAYEFDRAGKIYAQMAQTAPGQEKKNLEIKAITCQNGEAMLQFVSTPKVVVRKTLDKKDFFLYYPNISSLMHFAQRPEGAVSFSDTLIIPREKNTMYYSAKDDSGNWNIYVTKRVKDQEWDTPHKLGNNVNSSGNEIFPFITQDGKRLYFSSNGHYGAGGYDLYVSLWDEQAQDWGQALNMGFPYSSPGDDLFFYVTPDGKYAAFSSTRLFDDPSSRIYSTTKVASYVVEYEPDPIKKPATSKEVADIAKLRSGGSMSQSQRDSISKADVEKALKGVERKTGLAEMDPETRKITERYTQVALLYRQLNKQQKDLETDQKNRRTLYEALESRLREDNVTAREILEDSLKNLAATIAAGEDTSVSISSRMREAEKEILRIEGVFLSSGVEVPQNTLFKSSSELEEDAENNEEEILDTGEFLSTKAKVTTIDNLDVKRPKSDIDLTFRISKKGGLVNLGAFPEGLVYQIRFTNSAKKLAETSFKGLYPVFERLDNGRYVYTAGAFSSYSDASKQLARVKKLGFSGATIVAYENGKAIPVASARKKEEPKTASPKNSKGSYNVVVSTTSSSLSPQVLKAISSSGKDVAKVAKDDGFKFIAGPFSSLKEANALADKLKELTKNSVSVEEL